MKTKLIIPGIFILGLATAPMLSMANPFDVPAVEISFAQDTDKVKVEKENLPELVKETIKKDKKTSEAEFKEAWQMRGEDGKVYYAVKFDHNGTEISKKYDATGKEKEDKKD
jgi:hypothetical protein